MVPQHLLEELSAAREFELDVRRARDLGHDTLLTGCERDALNWLLEASRALADWLVDHPGSVALALQELDQGAL